MGGTALLFAFALLSFVAVERAQAPTLGSGPSLVDVVPPTVADPPEVLDADEGVAEADDVEVPGDVPPAPQAPALTVPSPTEDVPTTLEPAAAEEPEVPMAEDEVLPEDVEPPERVLAEQPAPAPPLPSEPQEAPGFDPARFDGVWRGESRGIDAVFNFRFSAEGSVHGSLRLTDGLRVTDASLIGTWTRDGEGIHVDMNTDEERPARYIGVLSGDLGSGQVIERGKTRGSWSARL